MTASALSLVGAGRREILIQPLFLSVKIMKYCSLFIIGFFYWPINIQVDNAEKFSRLLSYLCLHFFVVMY